MNTSTNNLDSHRKEVDFIIDLMINARTRDQLSSAKDKLRKINIELKGILSEDDYNEIYEYMSNSVLDNFDKIEDKKKFNFSLYE